MQTGCTILKPATIAALVFFFSSLSNAANLKVSVQDRVGKPLAGATIILHRRGNDKNDDKKEVTAKTDTTGAYDFSDLPPGTYDVRVHAQGSNSTASSEVHLEQASHASVSLRLGDPLATQTLPDFYDEPDFTVAGVTDTNNLGGHGSNVTVASSEALNRNVANLGKSGPPAIDQAKEIEALRARADQDPANVTANYELGRLLVENGKPRDALLYLSRAHRIDPNKDDVTYELAVAYADSGDYQSARSNAADLVRHRDSADSHHLLADVAEKMGDPLTAVREYQKAAQLDPSEKNIFDWATELLLHRAVPPAMEVFTRGARQFPRSARIWAGLGAARFSNGEKDASAQALCEASDLDPSNPVPYRLLGRVISAGAPVSQAIISKMERFAQLEPNNGEALYLYALVLSRSEDRPASSSQIESLLEKAIAVDSGLAPAYLELGILYSEKQQYPKAVELFKKASDISPDLAEAHYRLSLAYGAVNDTSRAQTEMATFKRLSKQADEALDRERREVQQFVYTLKNADGGPR